MHSALLFLSEWSTPHGAVYNVYRLARRGLLLVVSLAYRQCSISQHGNRVANGVAQRAIDAAERVGTTLQVTLPVLADSDGLK